MERSGLIATPVAPFVPALVSLFIVVLANLPVSLMGPVPPPLLALMPVYFWGLVRPDLMPPSLAFIIGVLEDLLSGGPPGIRGLAFVSAYALLDRQRDMFAGLSGAGAILGFAMVMAVASLTSYVTVALYYWKLLPLTPLLLEIGVSAFAYIPVAFALGFIHRRFVGAQRSDF